MSRKKDKDKDIEQTNAQREQANEAAGEAAADNATEGPEEARPCADEQETAKAAAADPSAAKLAELDKKCAEYLLLAQRTKADFENYKRRNDAARAQAYSDAVADTVSALLPVLDNFDRALAAIPAADEYKAIAEGVQMVKKQLDDVLRAKGVSAISDEVGQPFDAGIHNAVMTAPVEGEAQPDTVAATFQKGYKLGEKVIRYAMVSVYK